MRWVFVLALAWAILGLALAAPGHCQVPEQLAELRAEVRAIRSDVSRLVMAAERAADRRPAYAADLDPLRAEARAQVAEARAILDKHAGRITDLERSFWYLVGAGAVAAALGVGVWRSMALQIRIRAPEDHSKPPG